MADPVANPIAATVVTAPPSPIPQVQNPPTPQIPPAPGPQQFQPSQQAQPAAPQQAPQAPTPWHRAVTALLGNTTEYQQTPNGPVPVQVPNKPGNLFRSILAGAILGAGAGTANSEHSAGSGWNSAGQGAAAVQKNAQQQEQERAAQAQKQWENERQANQDSQEEMLRKAQLAASNMELLRNQMMLQGSSWDLHNKMAQDDKDRASTFTDAAIKPVYQDIPETEMESYIKNNQGASSLKWFHTGVKQGTDANGQPTYESTFTAYDPKTKVPLSAATVKQWDDDGLFKYHPEYKDILQPGKVVDVGQFTSVNQQARNLANQTFAKDKNDLELKKDQAAINADNARTAESLASTKKIRQEISDAALGKTQAAQFDKALEELNTKGGNFDALQPSSRVILAESMDKMVPALTSEYKDILASNDPDAQAKAGDVLSQIQNLTSLGTRALSGIATAAHPDVVKILTQVPGFDPNIAQKIGNLSPEEIVTQLQSSKLPDAVKNQILQAVGKPPVAAPQAPNVFANPGGALVNAVKQKLAAPPQNTIPTF